MNSYRTFHLIIEGGIHTGRTVCAKLSHRCPHVTLAYSATNEFEKQLSAICNCSYWIPERDYAHPSDCWTIYDSPNTREQKHPVYESSST